MNNGWILLYRSIWELDFWEAEPFTKGQAWVDLLLLANHDDQSMSVRGILINVKRGQLARSEETLAARWHWSRGKVERFVRMLKTRQMIEQQNYCNNARIIKVTTIVNYNSYQNCFTETIQQTGQQAVQQTSDKQSRNKEHNEHKEVNKREIKELIFPAVLDNDRFKSVWTEWLFYRQGIKHKLTTMTMQKQLDMLSKQADPIGVINQSIINGWIGLFAIGNKPTGSAAAQPNYMHNRI